MPRTPRVEYENAVYHVMARGDRREPIVFGDDDRELFVDTFGEACGRTGWEVFAWVLLDNHYHAVFRTPEPNLVTGMQWFQNAFTRRINSRHRLWGHLFGGRYKAIPVEDVDKGVMQQFLTEFLRYSNIPHAPHPARRVRERRLPCDGPRRPAGADRFRRRRPRTLR